MAPGVNFTRESAQRISDAVKKVESLPTPTNTQRHRAGGLGRMTLWEVTAIQTTPKTVTIKRVENQAGGLVDPSEREDILYDPDNEPSIGDRGLLIRLGEGSLFFFRRAKAGIERIFVTEQSYIDENNPDDTFGHPTTSIMRKLPKEKYGFLKFSSVIPSVVSQVYSLLSLGNLAENDFTAVDGSRFENVDLQVRGILEDFDPSTVTWNNQGDLDLSATLTQMSMFDVSLGVGTRTGQGPRGYMFVASNPNPSVLFNGDVYGLRVLVNFSTTNPNSILTARLERTALGDNFQSFVEWTA